MRLIHLIMPSMGSDSLLSEGEPFGISEFETGAADRPGAGRADASAKDGALGCSGCQDLGYCQRGLGPEELGAGCAGAGVGG